MAFYTGRISQPLLPGVTVDLAGQEFVIPPFSIKQAKATVAARKTIRDARGDTDKLDSAEVMDAYVITAKVGLEPNYPDVTTDILEGLTVKQLDAVLTAIGQANAWVPKPGEAAAPRSGAAELMN